jgi:O-antigen/teichoic acid export membrane protein
MMPKVRPSVVLALTQLIVEGSAFLRSLILARMIGAEEMGLAIAIALGIRVFEMAGDLGLERLLVQVQAPELNRVRGTVHLMQAVKTCLLTSVALMLAVPITGAINAELSPQIFALAAVVMVFRGFVNVEFRERQRQQDFGGVFIVEVGSNLAALIAIGPIVLLVGDYSAFAWASVLQAVIMCLLSHVIAVRRISWIVDTATIKTALRFGVPIACNGALIFLALQGDRLIVALNFSAESLAQFALAAQLTLLPTLAGARFLLAFDLPRFARFIPGSRELELYFRNRLIVVTGIATLLAVGLSIFGNSVVAILFGADYVSASAVMTLLAVTAGIRLVRAVPNTLLIATQRTSMVLACNLPRIIALIVALMLVAYGAELVNVVALGLVSEATGLILGLSALGGIDRSQFRLRRSSAVVSS